MGKGGKPGEGEWAPLARGLLGPQCAPTCRAFSLLSRSFFKKTFNHTGPHQRKCNASPSPHRLSMSAFYPVYSRSQQSVRALGAG